ncbi:hypothetical protein VQ03_28225 [Methylobacterium tarhaniae]|uniref:DUF6916 domain-containing protein n=1 Tax=Methylobacterium tarhaniae TaxID=1187852 RepID=A0A0J6S6C5_9HYPH|nr:hypothetical protein [Methylobacterium tarhaniae]KMO30755.1 hypothetical protein VQ03_28225 [Methylobacterium tarhaniae]
MAASLSALSAGLFTPVLGEAFAFRDVDGHMLAVTLARCDEHPRATMPGSPRTAFGLVFTCPADVAGAYRGGHGVLSHPALGGIGPLYVERILPLGFPAGTAAYEAAFS